ncbi:peptide-methionine (S)-S-oxide reductase [Psychroserpens sp. AS72]|uniref:peptide-methionine (S)-S-oxide reductase n=1 Tax=Psychroserpens sp. AS72 TaxID=3135775 RepID=UPI00317C4C05
MKNLKKIGFGGGCHWCTEAVFQTLKGVFSVEQGYIASYNENSSFSEGVCVNYIPETVNLQLLIEVHLLTHKSTVSHSMRNKYRSAIYTFSDEQKLNVENILAVLNEQYQNQLITLVLNFREFKVSKEQFTNYYYNNPEKPFCETFINPKLRMLLENYSAFINHEKLNHLKIKSSL